MAHHSSLPPFLHTTVIQDRSSMFLKACSSDYSLWTKTTHLRLTYLVAHVLPFESAPTDRVVQTSLIQVSANTSKAVGACWIPGINTFFLKLLAPSQPSLISFFILFFSFNVFSVISRYFCLFEFPCFSMLNFICKPLRRLHLSLHLGAVLLFLFYLHALPSGHLLCVPESTGSRQLCLIDTQMEALLSPLLLFRCPFFHFVTLNLKSALKVPSLELGKSSVKGELTFLKKVKETNDGGKNHRAGKLERDSRYLCVFLAGWFQCFQILCCLLWRHIRPTIVYWFSNTQSLDCKQLVPSYLVRNQV